MDPGRQWFQSFLKRHSNLAQRHAESINSTRTRVTEESLRKWHSDLKEFLITENGEDIFGDPDRIINADESGFNICPVRIGWIRSGFGKHDGLAKFFSIWKSLAHPYH